MSTEDQKNKARNMARSIKSPGFCKLCGRKKSRLERHHWAGYEPPHEKDIWFICKHANVLIKEHDGTSIEFIRNRYFIKFIDQTNLFIDEECGMEKRWKELKIYYSRWFVNWACAFKFYFPKSFHKQKEWFFNNVKRKEGFISSCNARELLKDLTENQIWDLGIQIDQKGDQK